MRLLILTLIIITSNCFAQDKSEMTELGYFGSIVNIHQMNNDSILVVSNGLDKHVQLYSLSQGEILNRIIRDGKGPKEAKGVVASVLENEGKESYLYINSLGGKFIKYNMKDSTAEETLTKVVNVSFMQVFQDDLIISKNLVVFPDQIKNRDSISIGYVLDKNSFKINKELKVSVDLFDIENIKGLERLDFLQKIDFKTHVVYLEKNEFLLLVRGMNKAFYLDDSGDVIKVLDLGDVLPYEMEVVNHEIYGYGVKTPGIINNISYVNSDSNEIIISFGQIGANIRSGYLKIIKTGSEFIISKEVLSEHNEVNFFDTNIYMTGKRVYIYGKAKTRTSELYLLDTN
ncbi:hypothetical protein [Gracilimonas sp.]|uniref:hypothetical protein n=1 Tax=Gracilimonas sp. TaxID=1974203 RepID=UPI002870C16B|nr:hypothetical protein [Gracilimonas sp.]